jgi:class 3 adenylate cyclase
VKPANILGDVSIPLAIGMVSARQFGKIFKRYDQIALQGDSALGVPKGENLSSASRARFKVMNEQLKDQGVDSAVLDRLHEFLHHADDLSVQRMRPYALADGWGLPRRAVLETFLRATRVGMLDLYWDLLCPECRGVAEDHARLNDIHATAHCNTCQIDFKANFDHNVEVIFRPNRLVRAVDTTTEFCVGSPQRQPHIVFSLIVPPREELPFSTLLSEGRYFLRSSHVSGAQILLATKGGAEKINFYVDEKGGQTGVTELGLAPRIRLINETDQAQTVELVRTLWSDQASTAADVTTLQVFRDLFSSEVLRPGEEISVGATTLMFTDLRNSTKLYREIGDAPAFGRVREHFEILERAVAAEGGSIVKTMGDAIMATFRSPVSAVRAIWTVQKQISERGDPPLALKIGIHHGPCIVVNLNDRLDYFGSTVNIAARLPNFSGGGEVIFSEQIYNDQEVVEFLGKNAPPNSLLSFQGEIRGYDGSMLLWRVKIN